MKNIIMLITLLILLSGCLTPQQEIEYSEMKAAGYEVVEKNTTTAALLGILPGVGSFYTGRIGWGIFDLLTWPYSICWDPALGHDGAVTRNYNATVSNVRMKKKRAIAELENLRLNDKITKEIFEKKMILINKKYSFGSVE